MNWSFLAGLGLGVVGGILFAPMRGERVREQLANSGRDLAERASQSVQATSRKAGRSIRETGTSPRVRGVQGA